MLDVRIVPAALLLAVITGCGGGNSPAPSTPSPTPAPTPSAATAATITIQTSARTLGMAAFVPNPVNVSQGGVITWSNTDSTTHDMVSDTGVWD